MPMLLPTLRPCAVTVSTVSTVVACEIALMAMSATSGSVVEWSIISTANS